ncbi:MAG: gliding motility-associated C-terminal domain-containing protein, partial [Phaeodactylibacter sp.]|nr:gliding motility-associated C-terminal domain-containing protein [Phaeodactylibacter sp.]
NGCTSSVSAEVEEPANLIIVVEQDSMSCDNLVATLSAKVLSGDDGNLQYLWSDGSTGPSIETDSAGRFTLMVSNACQEVVEEIAVPSPAPGEEQLLYVPNAFSPNEDGRNDLFLPASASGVEVEDYEFRVFNRWGTEVFSAKNLPDGWDGTFQGKRQNGGVYIWYVKCKVRACGQEYDLYKEGDVVLMR